MNSGIVNVESTDDCHEFHGYSGSVYRCYKKSYGTNAYGGGVLQNFIDKADYKIEIMPENTNWKELNYAI